jgi:hypothetical protein
MCRSYLGKNKLATLFNTVKRDKLAKQDAYHEKVKIKFKIGKAKTIPAC